MIKKRNIVIFKNGLKIKYFMYNVNKVDINKIA